MTVYLRGEPHLFFVLHNFSGFSHYGCRGRAGTPCLRVFKIRICLQCGLAFCSCRAAVVGRAADDLVFQRPAPVAIVFFFL